VLVGGGQRLFPVNIGAGVIQMDFMSDEFAAALVEFLVRDDVEIFEDMPALLRKHPSLL